MELKGSTLLKHALKHGYECAEHYLQDARSFLDSKVSGTIESFTSNEGYYFKYDKVTNEFGIINKFGGIST